MGSIPVRVTKKRAPAFAEALFLLSYWNRKTECDIPVGCHSIPAQKLVCYNTITIPVRVTKKETAFRLFLFCLLYRKQKMKFNCPVDSRMPPVQKLVAYNTVTIPVRVIDSEGIEETIPVRVIDSEGIEETIPVRVIQRGIRMKAALTGGFSDWFRYSSLRWFR